MKKLTSSESLITINHYKNLLASEGIPSEIRNEHLGSILGEMPFVETWPEIWVTKSSTQFTRRHRGAPAQGCRAGSGWQNGHPGRGWPF